MNIRWTLILGIIALSVLGWFYTQHNNNQTLQSLIKTPDSPDYIGYNMETTVFSADGKKQYTANASKIEHYTNEGNTDFQMPLVYLFDLNLSDQMEKTSSTAQLLASQSWKLSAEKARLTKDEMLYLEGNVVAESLDSFSRLQRIETQLAVVNLKTQDITSDTMVKIHGQNFNSSGLKLVGNLRQQIATLKEQVKTYYEVNK